MVAVFDMVRSSVALLSTFGSGLCLILLDTQGDGQYMALITLYRSLVFVVRLGPVRGTPPWFSPQVLVVRGDRQETRWLDLQEGVDLVHEDPDT